ncbi:MAG: hypothetical protein M1819_006757 [Sarea resinae]|nr:MAG: hypothetical protein M1819_006757 [Sarea resinae]
MYPIHPHKNPGNQPRQAGLILQLPILIAIGLIGLKILIYTLYLMYISRVPHSECLEVPISFVTISVPVTQTVYAIEATPFNSDSDYVAATSVSSPVLTDQSAAETTLPITTTYYLTSTRTRTRTITLNDEPTRSTTYSPMENSFYYAEQLGKTTWLDDKMPTSAQVVASETTTVIVSPLPVSSTSQVSAVPAEVNETTTVHFTETLRETVSLAGHANPSISYGRMNSGPGPMGWNATATYGAVNDKFSETLPTNAVQSLASQTGSRKLARALNSTQFCGEHGNFTLNFDDEPIFDPINNATADYPPVFNPYHHLFFSPGFAYAPPPTVPFPPTSPPHLAIFLENQAVNATSVDGSPDAGLEVAGEFGAGPRASQSAYWFNAYEANLGCDNRGPKACKLTISGYTFSQEEQQEILSVEQFVSLPPCRNFQNCKLTTVCFSDAFRNLTGVRIVAFLSGQPRIWFMDDVRLAWSNNTCAAGLERQESR